MHIHVLIVLKSAGLNVLEISGLVQACNGIALPFTLICKSSSAVRNETSTEDGIFCREM